MSPLTLRILAVSLWLCFFTSFFVSTTLLVPFLLFFASTVLSTMAVKQDGDAPARGEPDSLELTDEQRSEVQRYLAEGQKLRAVKRAREFTGSSLKATLAYVDSLPPGTVPAVTQAAPSRYPLPLPPELEESIQVIVRAGKPIEAIKNVRELTGVGLKEAKDYVDGLARQ